MKELPGTAADVLGAVLLLTGAAFCLAGAVGLLRFPDTATRLHAAAKAQTLGVLLVLLGAAVRVPLPYAGTLLLTAAFQLFTVPVTGQVVGRVAYRTGAVDRRSLEVDELARALASTGDRDRGEAPGGGGTGSPGRGS